MQGHAKLVSEIVANVEACAYDESQTLELLNFLEVLTRHPDKLDDIVKAGRFYLKKHDIHAGCPHGEEGGCADCYSGDTECEQQSLLSTALVSVFKTMAAENAVPDDSDGEEEDE